MLKVSFLDEYSEGMCYEGWSDARDIYCLKGYNLLNFYNVITYGVDIMSRNEGIILNYEWSHFAVDIIF